MRCGTDSSHVPYSFKQQTRLRDMIVLRNKAPKWNEQLHAYCLNFAGRVTEASVKNFQLVEEGNAVRVVLQFGKVNIRSIAVGCTCAALSAAAEAARCLFALPS